MIRMTYNQIVRHHAQLRVYLGLPTIAIPGSYGPGAEEQFAYIHKWTQRLMIPIGNQAFASMLMPVFGKISFFDLFKKSVFINSVPGVLCIRIDFILLGWF